MSDVVISHSEVDSYLLCPQRHFYAFGDKLEGAEKAGLEPKQFSDSLYRGIVGHKSLEVFYLACMNGSQIKDALNQAVTTIQQFANEPLPKYEILTDLSVRIIPEYVERVVPKYLDKGWKIKAVEHTYYLNVPTAVGDMIYPFKPDV